MNSEKTRILVFSIFFLALILFAIVYRPANALSNPADQNSVVEPALRR